VIVAKRFRSGGLFNHHYCKFTADCASESSEHRSMKTTWRLTLLWTTSFLYSHTLITARFADIYLFISHVCVPLTYSSRCAQLRSAKCGRQHVVYTDMNQARPTEFSCCGCSRLELPHTVDLCSASISRYQFREGYKLISLLRYTQPALRAISWRQYGTELNCRKQKFRRPKHVFKRPGHILWSPHLKFKLFHSNVI